MAFEESMEHLIPKQASKRPATDHDNDNDGDDTGILGLAGS
jgi:hypothetical protein